MAKKIAKRPSSGKYVIKTKTGTAANVSVLAAEVLKGHPSRELARVAASALTQKGGAEKVSVKVSKSASKILNSKTSSADAKRIAASALTQWPPLEPPQARASKIRKAVEEYYRKK